MLAAVVGVVTLLVGVMLGYVVRLWEFRRERRLVAYGDYVGAFLTAAHAGAAMFSVYIQRGENFYSEEHRGDSMGWWKAFGDAEEAFETATARLRLVGSEEARKDSEALEVFLKDNIREVPPRKRGADLEKWGAAAKGGPAVIDSEAVRLARAFADRAHVEVTGWRSKRPENEPPLA